MIPVQIVDAQRVRDRRQDWDENDNTGQRLDEIPNASSSTLTTKQNAAAKIHCDNPFRQVLGREIMSTHANAADMPR